MFGLCKGMFMCEEETCEGRGSLYAHRGDGSSESDIRGATNMFGHPYNLRRLMLHLMWNLET
jgi:hypothetical protein